jgi:hypothetical protein
MEREVFKAVDVPEVGEEGLGGRKVGQGDVLKSE